MTETTRKPRELSTRTAAQREVYQPPSALPDPAPDSEWAYRWVATHVMGVLEAAHTSKRFRDGWEPCKAEDHPELGVAANKNGNVEVGGLMLCRMPKERANAMNEYYRNQAERQMESVDNTYMRERDPRMPKFTERSSEVTRGNGFGSGTK